jgi:AraC-like DNA-binding protein
MERGVWLEREAFEELCLLVRDLAVCHHRLAGWLERRGPGAGGVMSQSVSSTLSGERGVDEEAVHPVMAGVFGEIESGTHSVESAPSAGESGRAGASHSRYVACALGFIEQHYNELIGLTTVASHVGCSRSHLARAFRREVGWTMQAYVREVRLRRAVSGVRGGDKVEAVMLDVGYRSKRNFYRLFKNRLGVSPGALRRGS